MPRILWHFGFVATALAVIYCLDKLNPPSLDFQLEEVVKVDCIEHNLSGISYRSETQTFFVISNHPQRIAEITAAGQCLGYYDLKGFEDTEDLFYTQNQQIILTQERKRSLDWLELVDGEMVHQQHLQFDLSGKPNRGLEGVSVNLARDEIFLAMEQPPKVYRLAGTSQNSQNPKLESVGGFWVARLIKDLSAVFSTQDGLYLLSEQSNRLLKTDYQGEVIASLDLADESDNPGANIQPEGLTIDESGNLYIVSEPNDLYIYKKTSD